VCLSCCCCEGLGGVLVVKSSFKYNGSSDVAVDSFAFDSSSDRRELFRYACCAEDWFGTLVDGLVDLDWLLALLAI